MIFAKFGYFRSGPLQNVAILESPNLTAPLRLRCHWRREAIPQADGGLEESGFGDDGSRSSGFRLRLCRLVALEESVEELQLPSPWR